ncbi:nucleoside hydrolase-like [Haemaphysalis longicornis]
MAAKVRHSLLPTLRHPSRRGPERSRKLKLIVDGALGISDALALALAFSSERASVEAVTIVAGNVGLENAYNNTLRVLKLFDMGNVPVYKGAHRPWFGRWKKGTGYFGPDGIGGASEKYPVADGKEATTKSAHVAIKDMIRERSKELTLVMLGPLTNLANAMRLDANLTNDVAGIFVYTSNHSEGIAPRLEYRFPSDLDAASFILDRATCPVVIVAKEATDTALLPWDVYDELTARDSTMGEFLLDITNYTVNCCLRSIAPGFPLGGYLTMLAALYPETVNGTLQSAAHFKFHDDSTQEKMARYSRVPMGPHGKRHITTVESFHITKVVEGFKDVFGGNDV